MMKPLIFVPMLALPFLFLGATCVTKVDQKGPTGPWVGEVTNTGPGAVQDLSVFGEVFDANGLDVMTQWADVCPTETSPGEKSYFMFDAHPASITADWPNLTLPLNMSSIRTASSTGFPTVTGVTFKVAAVDRQRNAILVEMHNASSTTYYPQHVCAVRHQSGEVQEVKGTETFLSTLSPRQTISFPIQFNSVEGTFDFSVRASPAPWRQISLKMSLSASEHRGLWRLIRGASCRSSAMY